MSTGGDGTRPFPPGRRGTVDAMRMAGRRSDVHGLVEFDVTDARRLLDEREAETGERLSFTAFLVGCLARAVADHPDTGTYRDWRGRLVTFDDVDVMVIVERIVDGEPTGIPHVLRDVEGRSVGSINEEIRAVQEGSGDPGESRWVPLFGRLPGPVRRLFYRLPQWAPRYWKQVAGTVAVSAVGMFGTGGGWGITPTNYTLQLTVGGISRKPGLVDGAVEPREHLHVTATFDHDVVDGAPAARFLERLRELVEGGHGLDPDGEA
jgi:pyruvate/2-oxoglutarate dehydrogenase complex dihydrolipoamide acyltransferase (E2) component